MHTIRLERLKRVHFTTLTVNRRCGYNMILESDHNTIIYMVQTAHVNSLPVSYAKGKPSPGVVTISTWKK